VSKKVQKAERIQGFVQLATWVGRGWQICCFLIHCIMFHVPCSNVGQGSQCRPIGVGSHVGPSVIPRKFPANILGTESHGGNSKEHNYPRPHDYSLYCGAHQRTSQPPQETTWQVAQPNSIPATWAVQSPTPIMPPSQTGQMRAIAGFPSQTGKP